MVIYRNVISVFYKLYIFFIFKYLNKFFILKFLFPVINKALFEYFFEMAFMVAEEASRTCKNFLRAFLVPEYLILLYLKA